eukprot:14212051-Alexandrium_andersonii.AAC.1
MPKEEPASQAREDRTRSPPPGVTAVSDKPGDQMAADEKAQEAAVGGNSQSGDATGADASGWRSYTEEEWQA